MIFLTVRCTWIGTCSEVLLCTSPSEGGVHTIKSGDRKRQLNWGWRTLTSCCTFKSKSGSKTERGIKGDIAFLFGKEWKIDRIGQYPIDGKEDNVYSSTVAVGPYSFFDNNNNSEYNKNAPPPIYISYEILNKTRPTKK